MWHTFLGCLSVKPLFSVFNLTRVEGGESLANFRLPVTRESTIFGILFVFHLQIF